MTKIQKPFLKWVGGKTQIIHDIIKKIPPEIENYHEPFVGGGSVMFAVLSLQKEGYITIKNNIYCSDKNLVLINVYKYIQHSSSKLYQTIQEYMMIYESCSGQVINRNPLTLIDGKTSKESYYYWLRKTFNNCDKETIECSALFIILNKLCFRGLYREGPNGFNVPFGHYKKTPTIVDKQELNNISKLIKNVKFTHQDFQSSFKSVNIGDFIYLDPPYVPEDNTSFVKYTEEGFDLKQHQLLFKHILDLENVDFVLSNSKVELVLETFKNYNMVDILCRRAINSKKPDSKTMEVVITNYWDIPTYE